MIAATREELGRAMRAAGWIRTDSDVYERRVPAPFVFRAQFWIEGAPVALQSTLWIACEAADRALEELGEDDAEAWVFRDGLGEGLTIERGDQVQTVVGEAVSRIG